MEPFTAQIRDGKIVLEIDARRFVADAARDPANHLVVVDERQFLDFAVNHLFTLSHSIDEEGARVSWWLRLTQALGKAAAAANRGMRRGERLVSTCGCDPEEHDGG